MSNLKNVRMKPVKIELDKERSLLFDLNAFAELEEAYGSINDAIKAMEKGSIKAVRAMLWAALIHEDPDLTQREVGAMVGVGDLEVISEAIGKAIELSVPEEKVGKGKN